MEIQENQNQGFNFGKFIEDSKNALLKPKAYFESMPTSGGFIEPIIKVLIYGVIIGIFAFLWGVAGLRLAGGPAWLGGGVGIVAFFGSITGSLFMLFVGGLILLIISAIFGGNTNYEANIRVVASLMVLNVIQEAFNLFDGINLYLGAIVSIAFSLYGFWMTYHALVHTLKAKENSSRIFLIIMSVLVVIFTFGGIAAKKVAKSISANYGLDNLENMTKAEREAAVYKSIEKVTNGKVKAEELQKKQDKLSMIEMADGTQIANPDVATIESSFDKINMDNDFIILNTSAGFIQAAINENGNFTVEYNDGINQYEATEALDKGVTMKIFIKYQKKDEGFKEYCEWQDFE